MPAIRIDLGSYRKIAHHRAGQGSRAHDRVAARHPAPQAARSRHLQRARKARAPRLAHPLLRRRPPAAQPGLLPRRTHAHCACCAAHRTIPSSSTSSAEAAARSSICRSILTSRSPTPSPSTKRSSPPAPPSRRSTPCASTSPQSKAAASPPPHRRPPSSPCRSSMSPGNTRMPSPPAQRWPTPPPSTTAASCSTRYHLLEKFPPSVRRFFSSPDLPETPGDKAALKRSANAEAARKAGPANTPGCSFSSGPAALTNWLATLLSNHDLLRAAQEKAAALGYEVVVDNGCDDWPYEKAAAYLVDRFIELRRQHPGRKLCLLSGGEVTVRIDRKPGTGGRNQQFALACALSPPTAAARRAGRLPLRRQRWRGRQQPGRRSHRRPRHGRPRPRPSASTRRQRSPPSMPAHSSPRSATPWSPAQPAITCATFAFC